MGTETELKLQLDAAGLRRLRRHALVQSLKRARPMTRNQKSVYFDTSDFRLRDQKVLLRVRHIGRRRIQTVKTFGECQSGAWARDEWETEIPGDEPERAPLLATGASRLFEDERLMSALRPVFATEVRRTTYRLGNGIWEAELAIDEGQVVSAQGSAPISEAEIELKSGEAKLLFDLALQLQQDLPARLITTSKAERGYALVEGTILQPEKSPPLALAADATTAEAFRSIAGACISQLLINQNCLVDTQDPEAIHQMRVAIRRLRSAMSVFKEILGSPETASLTDELRWLQTHLSLARDSVVFIEEILDPLPGLFVDDPNYAALRANFVAERDAAHEAAVKALSQPRFTQIVLRLGCWAEGGDWLNTEDPERRGLLDRPVCLLAQSSLAKRDSKLRKGMRHLADVTPEVRHRLRIQVKKLRYSIEFFGSLYQSKKVKRLTLALGTLQDRMGLLNDIAVSRHRLRERAGRSNDWLWIAGMIAGWHEARVGDLLVEAEDDWHAYDRVPRFWEE
jgi:inorganic triphosphatase YgiF